MAAALRGVEVIGRRDRSWVFGGATEGCRWKDLSARGWYDASWGWKRIVAGVMLNSCLGGLGSCLPILLIGVAVSRLARSVGSLLPGGK